MKTINYYDKINIFASFCLLTGDVCNEMKSNLVFQKKHRSEKSKEHLLLKEIKPQVNNLILSRLIMTRFDSGI